MIIASIYPCPFDIQDRHEFNSTVIYGEKIYSYEEGKLTTIKNDGTIKFPERSLMLGLKEFNILPHQVDKWVFPTPKSSIKIEDFFLFFSWFFKAYKGEYKEFKSWFKNHVEFVDHQLSHAALAVHGSTFSECAFLCMDGGGDLGDQRGYVFGDFSNNDFKIKFEQTGSDTIANFHAFITDSIGFSGENGKTSGLASYGHIQQELKKEMNKLISVSKENGVTFKRKRFSKTEVNLKKISGDMYDRSKIFNQSPSETNVLKLGLEYLPHDIASTGEFLLQNSVIKLVKLLRKETSSKNIVFSGGLFQNVALNSALLASDFENVYFPSAPSDSGLSLGAALKVKNNFNDNKVDTLSAFIGPSYTKNEIKEVLDKHRLIFHEHANIAKVVAKKISEGKTVGWFQGRAEFGPRSLGARSLLADPRNLKSKEKINQLLKKRDWFMPYAPSILEEECANWIESKHYSPYMQVAFDIKPLMAKKIPSAVHVDGTTRVHSVRKSENPLYWKLINEFKSITGTPVVLNTSFNRHGISTISSPRQAIEHFLEGCMDYLAIDNYLLSFKDNRIATNHNIVLQSEDKLLKINSIERLSVFKKHGTEEQMKKYLVKLSKLLLLPVKSNNDKKIIFKNKIYNIDDAIDAICGELKSK